MNEVEFSEWARTNQSRLTFGVSTDRDFQRAQDLVQEAMVKVALRWIRLRGGHPTAYARTMIVRDNISWWRTLRETTVEEIPDLAAVTSEPETALVVQGSLSHLTTRQRAVIVLRYFDDLTERETAEILGIAVGTVESTHSAALQKLRQAAPELHDPTGETR